MADVLFRNARVYRDHAFEAADVLVCGGVIDGVGPHLAAPAGCPVVDLHGMVLAPGFIDLHTHGGDGIDVNAATAEDLARIGAFFARHGTTGWQCSILTDTEEQTLWCIDQAKQAMAAGEHSFTVLVDNTTAVENLKRLAGNQGFGAAVTQGEGVFSVAFTRTGCAACEEAVSAPLPAPGGDWAVFVGRDIIGDGDRELGAT